MWAPGPQAGAQRLSWPAQRALSARAVRFHVCSIVLDQPVRSGRRVVSAARPRGDELGVFFWRQGEQLADTNHQGVQVVVHQSVDPIASRQRLIQPHQGLVTMVQRMERADPQLERLGVARHDGTYSVYGEEGRQHEHEQQ
jgi:extradiol dioxygenase family protein